jgi:hypothetical protein
MEKKKREGEFIGCQATPCNTMPMLFKHFTTIVVDSSRSFFMFLYFRVN